jgi:hypothetical protein
MSEIDAAPAAESSAPTSTSDVAANVIDSFKQTESSGIEQGSDPGDETPEIAAAPAPKAAPEPKAAPVAKATSEEEELLSEFGFRDAKKPDGRDHYIPRPKVLQMIASGLKRGKEKWSTERGVLESQATEYRGYLDELRAGVTGDPEQFLRTLASQDTRYARFLEQGGQAPAPQATAVPDDKPRPDIDLGNGQSTYSVEGVEALTAWKAQRMLNERLKPWEDRDKQAQQQQAQRQIMERSQGQMQTATSWPGFGAMAQDGSLSDFQTAVLGRLQQDSQQAAQRGERPSMSLREAYLEVYAEGLSTDHNAVREEVIRGLRTAPKAPALTRQGLDAPKAPGPMSTADAAARVLARMERGS